MKFRFEMKIRHLLTGLFCVSMFASCIQDEALNAEADIEYCVITDKAILKNPADTLFKANTDHNRITIRVKADADLSRMAPDFILTEGATISPKGGEVQDFSEGAVLYTVTSQDKLWKKTYEVSFSMAEMKTEYHFEHFEKNPGQEKYYQWYEVLENGAKQYDWATGNPGFEWAKSAAKPGEYPTVFYEAGVQGNAVKLETKSTGAIAAIMGMRIAAGNLFLGTFDLASAIKGTGGALKATNFGVVFNKKPIKLKGWYKYKSGPVFQNKDGKQVDGKKDACDIYSVFYENTSIGGNGEETGVLLNGADVLTHPNIVALARIQNPVESDEWTYFELPFVYTRDIDEQALDNYKYNISIVFSSSIDGAYFEGAVGSTLLIDEVELICDQK